MRGYRKLFRLFTGSRREIDREVEDEIRHHLDMRAAELERRGWTGSAARAEAERRFGDLTEARRALRSRVRQRVGRERRHARLSSVRSDVALAARRAVQAPLQTTTTIVTFALAIGLTTAGFTVVDRVLIRALPLPEPERLVALETMDSAGNSIAYLSQSIWLDWEERTRTLESLALYSFLGERWAYAGADEAYHVEGMRVTPGFFEVLGIPVLAGRTFNDEDPEMSTVIVSEGFWRSALGSAPLPVEADIANRPRHVVGVIPRGREYPGGTAAFMAFRPRRRTDAMAGESYNWLNHLGVARLAPGATVEQASAELAALTRAAGEGAPEAVYLHGARAIPLRDQVVGDARSYLLLLLGGAGVLLLIACANLAGIGVARASGRGQEIALRLALGAGRRRIVRQLLTEHLLLAVVGGALGAGLAFLATDLFAERAAAQLPRAEEIAVDLRVLAFTLLLSVTTGLLAGIVPALWASRASPREGLGGRGVAHGGRGTPGGALVAFEVALALVLLTGGSLLLRSFGTLLDRELGFDVPGIVTAETSLSGRYPEARWREVWPEIGSLLEARPSVDAVAFTNAVPTGTGGTGFIQVEGLEAPGGAGYRVVSDRYFEVMGIARLAGRSFGPDDREGTERVTVVDRAMAERYWPGESPVGRRVKAYSMEGGTPESSPWLTVVGVVETIRHHGHLGDERPEMYVTFRQVPQSWFLSAMTAVVRGAPGLPAEALLDPVRQAFREHDPRHAVEIRTLEARLSGLLSTRSTVVGILTGFAALSLLLAALGLYALLSFAVSRSMHEMGVRAALGAGRRGILGLVLGRAVRVVLLGAAVGILAAFWGTRLLDALLVDVAPRDPASFAAALLVLLAVTIGAALIPAWRASRADPVSALRP